jgi:hypothetical protein
MFRKVCLTFFAAALLAEPITLNAASIPLIVNATTNDVVFDDNFEAGIVNSAPIAVVGSWNTPGVTAAVKDFATAGFAANEGSQFLQINRNGSQEMFGYGVAANSGAGHDIVMTLAFRGGAGADGNFGAFKATSGTAFSDVAADVLLDGAGGVFYYDAAWLPLSQTYNLGVWNTAVITHTNGTSVYMLSINGATPESIGRTIAASDFLGVYLASPGNGAIPLYFDAVPVPEPTSACMAAIGLVGLVVARRRAVRV